LQVLFHGSKKVRAGVRARRAVFPDSMRTCAAFVNAKFPTTGFQFDTEIDAELAGGAAEFLFFHRPLSFSPYRAYVQKLGSGNDRSFSLTGASSARSIERLSRFLDGSNV
jgi:hypothetical protein